MFAIEELHLTFSNGAERVFERLISPIKRAVMIVPIFDDGTLLLCREYAAGTDAYELGFPKGFVELHESLEIAANRELKEEIGFGAKKLTPLKPLSSSPSYFGLKVDVFIAEGLYPERLPGDEPEEIEVVKWPISKIDELLQRDDFSEARSIAAIYLLERFINRKKKEVSHCE